MEVSCVLKYGNWGEYPLRFTRPPCRGTVIIGGRCTQRPYYVDVNRGCVKNASLIFRPQITQIAQINNNLSV